MNIKSNSFYTLSALILVTHLEVKVVLFHNDCRATTIYLIRVLITSLQLRRVVTITVSGWCRALAEYNAPCRAPPSHFTTNSYRYIGQFWVTEPPKQDKTVYICRRKCFTSNSDPFSSFIGGDGGHQSLPRSLVLRQQYPRIVNSVSNICARSESTTVHRFAERVDVDTRPDFSQAPRQLSSLCC